MISKAFLLDYLKDIREQEIIKENEYDFAIKIKESLLDAIINFVVHVPTEVNMNNYLNLQVKKIKESAKLPKRGSDYAAGYDLFACIDKPIIIEPHTTCKIGTGLAFALPHGFFGAIFARSGLATNQGLRPANCVGVCDEDYRGEYIVALHNDKDEPQIIQPNNKIAQLVLMPYFSLNFQEVDELSITDRGDGGFGSTGK